MRRPWVLYSTADNFWEKRTAVVGDKDGTSDVRVCAVASPNPAQPEALTGSPRCERNACSESALVLRRTIYIKRVGCVCGFGLTVFSRRSFFGSPAAAGNPSVLVQRRRLEVSSSLSLPESEDRRGERGINARLDGGKRVPSSLPSFESNKGRVCSLRVMDHLCSTIRSTPPSRSQNSGGRKKHIAARHTHDIIQSALPTQPRTTRGRLSKTGTYLSSGRDHKLAGENRGSARREGGRQLQKSPT